MFDSARERIESIIRDGYTFSISQFIDEAINLYRSSFWYFVLYALLVFGIIFIVQLIPVIGSLAVTFILGPCLNAGYYIALNYTNRNELSQFEQFFEGFLHWKELAIMTLIQIVILLAILIPFVVFTVGLTGFFELMEGGYDFDANNFPWILFIAFIPSIYLGVSWAWGTLFVVFYDYSPWEALETSRRLISRKWFLFLVYFIIIGFISVLGVIGFVIGLIFTIPFLYAAQYAAFANITRLNNGGEGGEHAQEVTGLVDDPAE